MAPTSPVQDPERNFQRIDDKQMLVAYVRKSSEFEYGCGEIVAMWTKLVVRKVNMLLYTEVK